MSINFDDLDTPLTSKPTLTERVERAQIVARAHIANGGEEVFDCPKCNGSGQTRWGACFSCQGKGKRSKRSLAASQAKVTREANERSAFTAFCDSHHEELHFLADNAGWSDFFRSLLTQVEDGKALFEKQVASVRSAMAKIAANKAAKAEARVAAAPKVEMSAIEALFATAVNNDIKRPIFRADGLDISLAPANGRNAGALYVKADGEYAGKIVGGKFHKVFTAPASVLARLEAVAADPLAESVKYARKTGRCGCCGKELVDPVSVRSGIGPICAENWGLEHRRDAARDSLAEDAAK